MTLQFDRFEVLQKKVEDLKATHAEIKGSYKHGMSILKNDFGFTDLKSAKREKERLLSMQLSIAKKCEKRKKEWLLNLRKLKSRLVRLREQWGDLPEPIESLYGIIKEILKEFDGQPKNSNATKKRRKSSR